jgi:hypothetical protein
MEHQNRNYFVVPIILSDLNYFPNQLINHCWDGLTVSVFDLVFVLKTVFKKPKTVSHGFSIHFSSHFLDYG